LGHRRDPRGLKAPAVLGSLAILLVLSLLALEIHGGLRRESVRRDWSSRHRPETLERAANGVRAAFHEMTARVRSYAEEIAAGVAALDLPPGREGSAAERLFSALFAKPVPEGLGGVLVVDDRGREVAWNGRVLRPDREILAAVTAGRPHTGVLRSKLHRTIVASAPIPGEEGLRGSAIAFLPFDVTYPVHNRYLPHIRVEEELARAWNVARVRIFTEEEKSAEPLPEQAVRVPLKLADGRAIAMATIEPRTRDADLAQLRLVKRARSAALGAALAAVLASLILRFALGGRLPEPFATAVALAVVVALRVSLKALGFPEAVGPADLLDPADFATTWLGGLLGNPGELVLTSLALAAGAALLARLAFRLDRDRPGWCRPLLGLLAAPAGFAATFAIWIGFRRLARAMVFDSTLDYVTPQTLWPTGAGLEMAISLVALSATVVLTGVVALLPAARTLSRIRGPGPTGAWIVLGGLLLGTITLAGTWGPGPAAPFLAASLAVAGWLTDRGRVRRFSTLLAIIVLPGTVLAFLALGPVVAEEVRSDLRSEAREIVRMSARGPDFAVDRFLARTVESPSLRRALSRPGEEAPGLAFRLWAGSPLSTQGIDCDVEVRDVDGRTISRWEIRMPPESWLPSPRPGRSVTRPLFDVVEGQGGARGRTFLVASTPVLDEARGFLGSVLVRVPTHTRPATERGPPEILRDVSGQEDPSERRTMTIRRYRGDRLVDTTDPAFPRSRRAPPEVVAALLEGDEEEVWLEEDRDGERWMDLYVPWASTSGSEPGLLSASVPMPGMLDDLRLLLRLLLTGAFVAALLYLVDIGRRLRRLRFRLRHKLLLSYLVLSALPMAMLARLNTDLAEERFRETLEERLGESLGVLTRELGRDGEDGFQKRLPDLLETADGIAPLSSEWAKIAGWRLNRDINVYVVSRLRASSEPGVFRTELFSDRLSARAFLEVVVRQREFFAHRERAGDYSFLTGYAPLRDPSSGEVIGALGVPMFWRQEALDQELARRNASLLAVYLLTLLLVVLVGIVLSNRISSPIQRLAEATRRLGGGDLAYRIPRSGGDEFGDLVESFNRMAGDLSESREKIVRAEKDAAWREMALQVAHEIKNPLTPMKLAAQQILRAWEDRHPEMERILTRAGETIVRQVENLRRIASDFGDFATLSVGEGMPIAVDRVVAETVALYAGSAERGVRIETESDDGLPLVRADPEDLRRVLINLVRNAIQALEPRGGGTIRILTRPARVRFEGAELPFVEMLVRDDGPGIPASHLERVFEPNFSTKSGGTGLGLAICRQIIESLGGEIRVESVINRGATIRIHLPAADTRDAAPDDSGSSAG
jgi:two-component system nitrogen regulation sensor histidine kinase NtrY